MTVDVRILIEWLGVEGAQAGILASDLTIADLQQIATQLGVDIPARAKRAKIVSAVMSKYRQRVDKPVEDLMKMSYDELVVYFGLVKPSRSEILEILRTIDVRPSSKARGNLVEFAAREISDMGLFSRVAMGTKNGDH